MELRKEGGSGEDGDAWCMGMVEMGMLEWGGGRKCVRGWWLARARIT